MAWQELAEASPNIDLQEAEDFILFWYVHGNFPKGMEPYDVEIVCHALQEQLAQLQLNEPDACRKRAHELWEYRCFLKENQLNIILDDMPSNGR